MEPRPPHHRSRLAVLAAGAAGVLALLAAAVRPPWQVDPDTWFTQRAPGEPPLPAPVQTAVPDGPSVAPASWSWPDWLSVVLIVVALAAAAAGIVVLLRWWRRRRANVEHPDLERPTTSPAMPEPDLPTLLRGAATADERLLAIADPTDAIVAAWLALEEAAAESGVPRPAASTPTEFTADVLGRTGAPGQPVHDLLTLYLRVRFGTQPATSDDLATTRRCVRELATHWSAYTATSGRPG